MESEVSVIPFSLGPLAAFAASFTWVWGSSTYVQLSKTNHFLTINLTRSLVSTLLGLLVLLTAQILGFGDFFAISQEQWVASLPWLAAGVLMSVVLGDALFFLAGTRIGITNTQAVAATYPLWASLVGIWLLGDTIGGLKWIGIILSVICISMLILGSLKKNPLMEKASSQSIVAGFFLAFGTSLFWAGNSLFSSKGASTIPVLVANTTRMASCAMICAVGVYLFRKRNSETIPFIVSWSDFKLVKWPLVMESFAGSFLFVYGISRSSFTLGVILTSMAPIISLVFLAMQGKESITLTKVIYLILLCTGVALVGF
jgi:drug/metabolite transporter (DMT)-like permease